MKSSKRMRVNLREERKKRGLSTHQVNNITKIPLRYIEALETGVLGEIKKGPRLFEAKLRYLRLLKLPQDSKLVIATKNTSDYDGDDASPMYDGTGSTNELPQSDLSRMVAHGIIFVMIAVICIKVTSISVDSLHNPSSATENLPAQSAITIPEMPPKEKTADFVLRTRAHAKATIIVDGIEKHREDLTPNHDYAYDFKERIEVWSDNVSLLELELEGSSISPQGAVANERKLIFEHTSNTL